MLSCILQQSRGIWVGYQVNIGKIDLHTGNTGLLADKSTSTYIPLLFSCRFSCRPVIGFLVILLSILLSNLLSILLLFSCHAKTPGSLCYQGVLHSNRLFQSALEPNRA